MSETQERQITGDDIIAELLRNCDASRFPLRRSVLLPSLFYVYLHPADFDTIRPVLAPLKAEARAALAEKLDELNDKATPGALGKLLGNEKKTEYRIADPDWTIEFFPDAEDKLARGEIEIHSELASAPRPDFDGAMTRHVTRRLPTAPVSDAAPAAPTEHVVYARLRYEEAGVPREFAISKPQTVIGRGGKTHWVDLKLDAPPDVSREHCRIRRDGSGRFYLSDSSQFGTVLNGSPVPSGGAEVEIPRRASIVLAGIVTLEFEAS
jgi:hypothetical protein